MGMSSSNVAKIPTRTRVVTATGEKADLVVSEREFEYAEVTDHMSISIKYRERRTRAAGR
jgi:hypothetical protein